jgi:saccharopine dehydrogenase-like NADP-dependent oxidoreductase
VIACRKLSTAQKLIEGLSQTNAITLDVSSSELDQQISEHDLVISLVPYVFHAAIIKSAIKSKVNVVTTSYVSPTIKALDAEAKAAGITILNEVGVDPGVDHLYAIKKIQEIQEKGGKVCCDMRAHSILAKV